MLIDNYIKWKWIKCPNQKTQTDWMDFFKKTHDMLSARDSLQTYIETEREGMEKDISCKWQTKEDWNSNTHTIKNKL